MAEPLDLPRLLRDLAIQPVLVDIGASAGPPTIWDPIAACSTYIGVDADARDRPQDTGGRYRETRIIDRAVTAGDMEDATFFLTRSPHCSSTLRPDAASLADYAFVPAFDVVSEVTVPAISLAKAFAREGIAAADWIKLDTQGTDLRLFQSLSPQTRARTLALDVEPGLIDAYQGEDLFIDTHRALCAQGFWLSRLGVGQTLRGAPATIAEMRRIDPRVTAWSIDQHARTSPGWAEARYLRTAAALAGAGLGQREYLLLGIFAVLDEQWIFAFEIMLECERRFGAGAASAAIKDECVSRVREPEASPAKSLARRVLSAEARRRLRNIAAAVKS